MPFKINKLFNIIFMCIFTLSLVACSENEKPVSTKKYKAVIVQHVETDSFTNMRDGFLAGMKAKGYTDQYIEFDYKNAHGDMEKLKEISKEIARSNYDFIVAIATPATGAIVDLERKIPIFYIGVTDTARAGVMRDPHIHKNATGTAMPIPVVGIFNLVKQLTPEVKTFGIVHNDSETSAIDTATQAKNYLPKLAFQQEEFIIDEPEDLNYITKDFINSVDAFFIPNDTMIEKNISAIIDTAINAKKPLYCSTNANVYSGCFATISVSTFQVGESTADMLIEYIKGEQIEEITPRVLPAKNILINEKTAKAIGVTIPKLSNVTLIN